MSSKTICVSLLMVLVGKLQAGGAVIVADSGNISESTPPPSVEYQVLESDNMIFVFAEQTSTTLTSDINVDISSPGTVVSLGSEG